jgi:6-phosphogluconolactonase (cycloisomerase 2 family)
MKAPLANVFAVCDWGSDRVYMMRIDERASKLQVCGDEPYASLPGSKPRYCAFHPTEPLLFVNHEGRAVISAFRYTRDGRLHFLAVTDVLPATMLADPTIAQSDLRIHPSGTYLYSVVRGLKSVVSVFALEAGNGALSLIQTFELEGGGPRGCAVSPDGRFLYVALTSIQKVVILRIATDGKLTSVNRSISQPNPGNITFITI